jgi:hypothetical protein
VGGSEIEGGETPPLTLVGCREKFGLPVSANRVTVDYWRSDSDRWVPVEVHEHVPAPGVDTFEKRDRLTVTKRLEIEREDAGSDEALSTWLRRETFNEPELIAWCYPDAWDRLLRRLGVEYPLPDEPIKWKDGHAIKA